MATYRDPYSRMVGWLKIIFPLSALAILATLFLVSPRPDLSRSLPISKSSEEIRRIAQREGIGNPSFSGITEDGIVIRMTAEHAGPTGAGGSEIAAQNLAFDLESPSGLRISARAKSGKLFTKSRHGLLTGGVSIETSTGYKIETQSLNADLRNTRVETLGPVTAQGPLGEFTAGQMLFAQKQRSTTRPAYELVFTGGVHLIYKPRK